MSWWNRFCVCLGKIVPDCGMWQHTGKHLFSESDKCQTNSFQKSAKSQKSVYTVSSWHSGRFEKLKLKIKYWFDGYESLTGRSRHHTLTWHIKVRGMLFLLLVCGFLWPSQSLIKHQWRRQHFESLILALKRVPLICGLLTTGGDVRHFNQLKPLSAADKKALLQLLLLIHGRRTHEGLLWHGCSVDLGTQPDESRTRKREARPRPRPSSCRVRLGVCACVQHAGPRVFAQSQPACILGCHWGHQRGDGDERLLKAAPLPGAELSAAVRYRSRWPPLFTIHHRPDVSQLNHAHSSSSASTHSHA